MSAEPDLERAVVAPELAAEFPGLALVHVTVAATPRRPPEHVRARLRLASDRFTGAKAIVLRQQPIPWAYRVFFRHIGIDPDERRTPIEALALERLRAGGFKSRDLVADAILLATLDTGVALSAIDASRLAPPLELRPAGEGERLGEGGLPLAAGRLVVADREGALAVMFGEVSPRAAVTAATRTVTVCAIQVDGVPDVAIEEALWGAADVLASA